VKLGPIIDTALELLWWAILVRAILSWFRVADARGPLYTLRRWLEDLTEPVLAPIRRIVPENTALDFSPIVAMVLIDVVRRLVRAFVRI
jgi:YggT family protein